MTFLAHFTNTPLTDLMEWEAAEIRWWYTEAVKLHNKMNPAPD